MIYKIICLNLPHSGSQKGQNLDEAEWRNGVGTPHINNRNSPINAGCRSNKSHVLEIGLNGTGNPQCNNWGGGGGGGGGATILKYIPALKSEKTNILIYFNIL